MGKDGMESCARAGASRHASRGVGQLTTISDPVAARLADLLLYADDIVQLPCSPSSRSLPMPSRGGGGRPT
jgi:hypothetical protein